MRIQFLLVAASVFMLFGVATSALPQDKATNYQGGVFAAEQREPKTTIIATGKLEPSSQVDVGSQVSGQIIKLHVEPGDMVEKGDLLAEIDPRSLIAAVTVHEESIAHFKASLIERQAILERTRANYNRYAELSKNQAVTAFEAQLYEMEFNVAKAQVTAAEALIRQAEATLEKEELNLSHCRIYSPLDGMVISVAVSEGQILNNNQTVPILMRVANLDTMTMHAAVSEVDIGQVKVGMEAFFSTSANPDELHSVRVKRILPSYSQQDGVVFYNVLFTLPNEKGVFLPGMNTQVTF